jgi:hypothetical protein
VQQPGELLEQPQVLAVQQVERRELLPVLALQAQLPLAQLVRHQIRRK